MIDCMICITDVAGGAGQVAKQSEQQQQSAFAASQLGEADANQQGAQSDALGGYGGKR